SRAEPPDAVTADEAPVAVTNDGPPAAASDQAPVTVVPESVSEPAAAPDPVPDAIEGAAPPVAVPDVEPSEGVGDRIRGAWRRLFSAPEAPPADMPGAEIPVATA